MGRPAARLPTSSPRRSYKTGPGSAVVAAAAVAGDVAETMSFLQGGDRGITTTESGK